MLNMILGEVTLNTDMQKIRDAIKSVGYVCLQTSESIGLALNAKQEYLALISDLAIHATSEQFSRDQLLERPWRKMAIGSMNGLGESYAQFLMTTYFSESNVRTPNITAYFNFLIGLRNRILDMSDDFGRWDSDEKYWNASRIHHYPQGGGFMVEHHDTHFPRVLGQSQIPFLQVMGLMSARGLDFQSGGGFITQTDGTRLFFEDENSVGKIVMFDGSIRHGVADVDADKVFDIQGTQGRYAAFVNVYEKR
jgi:hypothetical protein